MWGEVAGEDALFEPVGDLLGQRPTVLGIKIIILHETRQ